MEEAAVCNVFVVTILRNLRINWHHLLVYYFYHKKATITLPGNYSIFSISSGNFLFSNIIVCILAKNGDFGNRHCQSAHTRIVWNAITSKIILSHAKSKIGYLLDLILWNVESIIFFTPIKNFYQQKDLPHTEQTD